VEDPEFCDFHVDNLTYVALLQVYTHIYSSRENINSRNRNSRDKSNSRTLAKEELLHHQGSQQQPEGHKGNNQIAGMLATTEKQCNNKICQ